MTQGNGGVVGIAAGNSGVRPTIEVPHKNIEQYSTSVTTYTITFDSKQGSYVAPLTNKELGDTLGDLAVPTRSGYIFQGWYTASGTKWDFGKDVITGDTVLYARWAKFKVENGVLTECTATGDVVIPEFFDGQLITAIGDNVFKEAIQFAFTEGPMVIVEQGIKGRELTCAAYAGKDGVKALPLIEIVTDNDYFDYDAKYNGHSQEICPAPVEESVSAHIQEVTKKIYTHLGCEGVVRVDYILAEDGLYFLEVNTIPGMTSASLVPKMVRTAGIDITDFLTDIIENS